MAILMRSDTRIGSAEVDDSSKNKLAFVRVHYSLLKFLLLGQIRPAVSSLPPDVEVVDVGFGNVLDRCREQFSVVLRSRHFDEVAEGNRIPEIEVTFREIPAEGGGDSGLEGC